MSTLSPLFSSALSILVGLIGPVVGFILVALRSTGRARLLGMIGFAVAAVLAVVLRAVNLMLPQILHSMELSISAVYGVWGLVSSGLDIIVWVLLAFAIIANRGTPDPQSPPQPGVYGSRPA